MLDNANIQVIAAAIVTVITGIWGWLDNRKSTNIANEAKKALAKAILIEINHQENPPQGSPAVIEEFVTKAKTFTESETLNNALVQIPPAQILWYYEQLSLAYGAGATWE